MTTFWSKISQLFQIKPPKKEPPEEVKEKKEERIVKKSVKDYTQEHDRIIREARTQTKEIILEAKDEAFKIKQEAERDIRSKQHEFEKKLLQLSEREHGLSKEKQAISEKLSEIEQIKKDQLAKLERAANLTVDEAKKLIMSAVENKMKAEIAKYIQQAETRAKEEAENKAREIIVDAMRHGVLDYVSEYTVSSVKLSDEDMKGRIIGKEGRNIRAFEQATGVDVDLDEEGVIRLSSFDPVRREIAKVALEKLIRDGRIQPARIEEIVAQTQKETERIMFKEGENLCHEVGVYNLPADMVALLGRFKYRFSYGQNMIVHTLEEVKIGMALASELKADVNIIRLGCLLHDIGKVITDKEGSHIQLGVDFLKKYGIPKAVIDSVAQHHEDAPFTSVESVIVYVADAISGGRPGARYEDYQAYIKRLKELEDIATKHKGVEKAYAFQAGRELRVIIDPNRLDDAQATILAQNIKEEIEKKITYPGQIKVTIIRELRVQKIAV